MKTFAEILGISPTKIQIAYGGGDSGGSKSSGGGSSSKSKSKPKKKDSGGKGGNDKPKEVEVKSGDTLSEIAEANNTSVAEIMKANDISDPNKIQAGATLNLGGVQTGVGTYDGGVGLGGPTSGSKSGSGSGSNKSADDYFAKLQAAGEEDMSGLDAVAASNPNAVASTAGNNAAAVNTYYTSGAGSDGYTSNVDYSQTNSGNDFATAAAADNYDVSGGTAYSAYQATGDEGGVNIIDNSNPEMGGGVVVNTFSDNDPATVTNPPIVADPVGEAISMSFGNTPVGGGMPGAEVDLTAKYTDTSDMNALDQLAEEQFGSYAGNRVASYNAGNASAIAIGEPGGSMLNETQKYAAGDQTSEVDYSQTASGNDFATAAAADDQTNPAESGLSVGADLTGSDNFTGYDNGIYYKNGVPLAGHRDGIYYHKGVAYDNAADYQAARAAEESGTSTTSGTATTTGTEGGDGEAQTGGTNTVGTNTTGVTTTGGGGDDTGGGSSGIDTSNAGNENNDEVVEVITGGLDEDDADGTTTTPYQGNDGLIYNADGSLYSGEYTYNGVTYVLQDGQVIGTTDINITGGGSQDVGGGTVGGGDNTGSQDPNAALQAEIDSLRQQLALLTGGSTQETAGMTREEIMMAINDAMRQYNTASYDPLAFMNAFGFAMNPTYFGEAIPSFMSKDGVYTRRAVRDKDTGEIRYVNVPIAAQGGNVSQYRKNRREGFGSLI